MNNLISGDAIFGSSTIADLGLTIVSTPVTFPDFSIIFVTPNSISLTCGSCAFSETLSNGSMLSGLFALQQYNISTIGNIISTKYSGSISITGGTGLLAGYTGAGHFSGADNSSNPFSQLNIDYTIDSPAEAPSSVPLPAATWLFGSGIMSFFGLRRKSLV